MILKAVNYAPLMLKTATTLTYKGSPERLLYYFNKVFHRYLKNFPQVKMISKVRTHRQDTRTWAIEQLIKHESCLDPRMYACADCYASTFVSQVVDDLYTLWIE